MTGSLDHRVFRWYERAVRHCDYPMDIIGNDLTDMISPPDEVIDAGAGIGPVSLAAAPLCRRVVSVDSSPDAITELNRRATKAGVTNIETVLGEWLTVQLAPCDVAICAYAIGISRDPRGLQKIMSLCKRGLILTTRGAFRGSYALGYIAKKLGLRPESDCPTGCLERGLLEGSGATVSCRPVVHDFGQPVDSVEEAWNYVRYQLKVGNEHDYSKGLDLIQDVLETDRGQLYLPIRRHSCIIRFESGKKEGN